MREGKFGFDCFQNKVSRRDSHWLSKEQGDNWIGVPVDVIFANSFSSHCCSHEIPSHVRVPALLVPFALGIARFRRSRESLLGWLRLSDRGACRGGQGLFREFGVHSCGPDRGKQNLRGVLRIHRARAV